MMGACMSLRTYAGVLAVSGSLLLTDSANAQWVQTTGPSGGRTKAVLARAGEVYAGATYGLYQSLDNGDSWTSVTSGGILSLAFAGDVILAGTYDRGLLRSTDNGATWVASEPQLSYIQCLAADAAHAYLGDQSGIYVSDDDGATWILGGWVPGFPEALAVQGDYGFVGTTEGIARSSDNGMSWAPANNGLGNKRVRAIAAAQSALFAGTEGGVFKSTDMGSTWSAASNGLTDLLIIALAVADDGMRVFAASLDQGVFRSSDGGISWTAVGSPMAVFSLALEGQSVFAGIVGGALRSTDSGSSWSDADFGDATGRVEAFCRAGADVLAAVVPGIWRWDGGDLTWTNLHFDGVASALAVTEDGLWAGTVYEGLYRSSDQGTTWALIEKDQLEQTVIFSIHEHSSYLFLGTTAGIFRSANHGANWMLLGDTLVQGSIFALASSGTTLYAATEALGPVASTDWGQTWTRSNPDGGQTGFPPYNTYAIAFLNDLMFAAHAFGVEVSSDGGKNWAATGLLGVDVEDLVVHESSIFAGTREGVLLSTDFGAIWGPVNDGLESRDVSNLLVSGSELFLGTVDPVGVWRADISSLVVDVPEPEERPRSHVLAQNYPNPFNPTTRISFQLPVAEHVRLSVFDVLGREVAVLMDEMKSPGVYELQFDGTGLTSGVYLYRLQAGNTVLARKMALVR